MSDTNPENFVTTTEPVAAIFLNVIEARAIKKNGKEVGDAKFDVTLAFEPTSADLAAIKAKMVKVAQEKWPGRAVGKEAAKVDANGNPKQSTFAFPLASGDALADKGKSSNPPKDREAARGKVLLTARSKYQPTLSVIEGGKVLELSEGGITANKNKFYPGVKVLVRFELRAYEGGTGPDGVSARLFLVASTNKGTRIGGQGRSSAEVFKDFVGTVSDEDPTAGVDLDDEIPF